MAAAYEMLTPKQTSVGQVNRELSAAAPEEILAWALQTFGDAFCITTSLAEAALVDMASKIRPGVHVVFVDTGYHFAETLRTRARLIERYPIHLVSALPGQTVAEQDAEYSPALFERDPDLCCRLRKVEPITAALGGYDAWASGIRRDETSARRTVGVVEWDVQRAMVKVNPLANWTQADVDQYIEDHDVLVNPLRADGYPSIGCSPCTRPAAPGADVRSGRWVGLRKTECGLHSS
jgi:phosphoadenosine phosphosulfate reductase